MVSSTAHAAEGAITGTVLYSGAPVPDFYVYVYSKYGYVGYAVTDADGVFTVGKLPTGAYVVEFDVWDTPYIPRFYGNANIIEKGTVVSVTDGSTTSNIDVSLTVGGSISGRVTDAEGVGLSNVNVTVFADSSWGYSGIQSGTTDADGAYTVVGLTTGTYKVQFYGAPYISKWYGNAYPLESRTKGYGNEHYVEPGGAVAVTAGNETPNIDVSLTVGGSISGTVTDEGGIGLPDVSVYVHSASGSRVGYGFTDSNGAYTVGGMQTGSYRVNYQEYHYISEWYDNANTFEAGTVVGVTAGNDTPNIDASLMVEGSISGRVTDAGGVGLYGVPVTVFAVSSCGGIGKVVYAGTTYTDGAYTANKLPTGTYKVEFYDYAAPYIREWHEVQSKYIKEWYGNANSFETGTSVGVTAGNDTPNIDASLADGGSISGTVTDDGGVGVADVKVTVYAVSASGYSRAGHSYTDADGAYTVGGLPAGTYKVEFYDFAGAHLHEWYDIHEGRYIREKYDLYEGPHIREWYGNADSFETGTPVGVTAGNDTPNIDASLADGGSISGTVTDEGGVGIAHLEVAVYAASVSGYKPVGHGWTKYDGTYTFGGLPSGDYKVEFIDNGGAYVGEWYDNANSLETSTAVGVTVGSTTPNINASLLLGGSISGRVTDEGGAGLSNVNVTVYAASASGHSRVGYAFIDYSEGFFTVGGLPTGTYKVQFDDNGGKYISEWYGNADSFETGTAVGVTVGSKTPNIDASLADGGSISGTVTDAGGVGLTDVYVKVSIASASGYSLVGSGYTNNCGDYTVTGLPTGTYKVEFDNNGGEYISEWYDNADSFETGTAVNVTAGSETSGIDASLSTGLSGMLLTIEGDAAWTRSRVVTLTLTATGGSAPIRMCISNTRTCTAWTAFSATKAWKLSDRSGTKTVYARFRDALGNTTPAATPYTDTIVLDMTRPVNGTVKATKGAGQITLDWDKFADGKGSGIESYKVVFAVGAAPVSCAKGTLIHEGPSTTRSYIHTPLINRIYGYRVCATDTAGNVSAGATASARPLTTEATPIPPVGSIAITDDDKLTKSRIVTLALTASDASEPIQMCISNTRTCTAWTAFSETKTWRLARRSGNKTVYARFRDTWGNTTPATTPYTDTIVLDMTRPVNGAVKATKGVGQITLDWDKFSDALSGIDSYKVVFAFGAAPASCAKGTVIHEGPSTTTSFTHTPLTNRLHGYRVCAIDKVGNISIGAMVTGRPGL